MDDVCRRHERACGGGIDLPQVSHVHVRLGERGGGRGPFRPTIHNTLPNQTHTLIREREKER